MPLQRKPALLILLVTALLTILYFLSSAQGPQRLPARKPSKEDGAIKSYILNSLTATSRSYHNQEQVLVLTPLEKFSHEYWTNLLSLTYPRPLVELGFIVPADVQGDATLKLLDVAVKKVQTGPAKDRFAKVTILRKDPTAGDNSINERDRLLLRAQKHRRSLLALLKNSLLLTTIGPHTAWILWLDSNIVETPPTLIQDMALHNKAIIVANCFQRYVDPKKGLSIKPDDFSSWQESEKALELAKQMGEDDIIVEGFPELVTYRALMAYMYDATKEPHVEVPLDGVASTVLLVKAEVHRDGAMFPPFAFYNLIEAEGFAKMAKRLGYQAWGLPNYLVYHSGSQ